MYRIHLEAICRKTARPTEYVQYIVDPDMANDIVMRLMAEHGLQKRDTIKRYDGTTYLFTGRTENHAYELWLTRFESTYDFVPETIWWREETLNG